MEEEYTYESEVDNNLQCPICRCVSFPFPSVPISDRISLRSNAFVEPTMSSACQHVFCLDCISTALSLSPTCPIDRSRLSRDDLVPAPRIIQQMVQELRVVCPYAKHGCAVVCERSLLSNHLQRECKHKGKGKQTEQEASIDDEAVERCAECDQLVKLSQSSVRPQVVEPISKDSNSSSLSRIRTPVQLSRQSANTAPTKSSTAQPSPPIYSSAQQSPSPVPTPRTAVPPVYRVIRWWKSISRSPVRTSRSRSV